ncbi:MAG: NAD-dependent epimerase/dehydratase family protein [Pseudomonadota bacterium]
MSTSKRILVVGASQPLGEHIAACLARTGHKVIATSRLDSADFRKTIRSIGASPERLDLTDRRAVAKIAPSFDLAVLTPILSISGEAARILSEGGVRRGIVFSSNNVAITPEEPVYGALRKQEVKLQGACPDWAIIRPTMIYGYPGDGNLSGLLKTLSWVPLFPVPGNGKAVQQPIHVEDLAQIATALANGDWDASGILPIGGPDAVTHRAMLQLIKRIAGGKGIILPLPVGPVKSAVTVASELGIRLPLTPAQIGRVDLNKAAVDPADVPDDLVPQTPLETGLRNLATEMGLKP